MAPLTAAAIPATTSSPHSALTTLLDAHSLVSDRNNFAARTSSIRFTTFESHRNPRRFAHTQTALASRQAPRGRHPSVISASAKAPLQEASLEVSAEAPGQSEATATSAPVTRPRAKICGVTSEEDAAFAAANGAAFVGMILWPKAKRSIPLPVAARVAAAARAGGAVPVGVFVDESAAEIEAACREAGVFVAQLHGDGARASLSHLPPWLSTVFVLHADKSGTVQTALPSSLTASSLTPSSPSSSPPQPDWILIDGIQGGSGERFDWTNLKVPSGESRRGWILAGGLNAENVAEAATVLAPSVVDVSSGVTKADAIQKDPVKVAAFLYNALGR